jgi:hypothetical protein
MKPNFSSSGNSNPAHFPTTSSCQSSHPIAQHVAIKKEVQKTLDYDDEYPSIEISGLDHKQDLLKDAQKEKELNTNDVTFSDQIKIDFIPSIDYRILCRFLGVTSVNDIKNHPYQSLPLISLILMECMNSFMDKEGFDFVGELNFDNNGNAIPPFKNPWQIKGKETTFTITGFLYFKKRGGTSADNIAFFVYSDLDSGASSIISYSTRVNTSKKIINDLEKYAKKENCLRGAKLKDINMISASFAEVEVDKKYKWKNYYYSKSVRDLFELEVFGFVKNIKKYNSCGITKRGIILEGKPGCVLADTKIKIRKKKKEGKHNIIEE